MAAYFAALFCVVVCSSFTVSLACEGPDLQNIVEVLKDITNWEELSGWLNVKSSVVDGIKENCLKQSGDLATCYRMRLVKHYCNKKTAHTPRQVADDMANVLETNMINKLQADKLRKLKLTGSADRHPPSLSDSDPLEGYWVFIAVALALIAVTAFIYLVYTRAGPLPGVPPAGVPLLGVTSAGVPHAGVPPTRVPHAGVPSHRVPHAGVPLLGVTSADHTVHPGYERVRRNMVDLTHTLKSNQAAKCTLTLYYKQHKWLDITEYPTEDKLVTLALTRIEQDPSQYDRFVDMLRAIEGMDLIVDAITAGPHHSPTPNEPAHDMTVEPPKFPDLMIELYDAAHRWKSIGLVLGLSLSSIDRTSADYYRVHDCMEEMLREWKNKESSTYTWQTIVEALRSVKELRLARDIEQKYILKRNN